MSNPNQVIGEYKLENYEDRKSLQPSGSSARAKFTFAIPKYVYSDDANANDDAYAVTHSVYKISPFLDASAYKITPFRELKTIIFL